MKCPQCDHDNNKAAKFCAQCGRKLGVTCPECQSIQSTEARFCTECGHCLSDPTPAPAGARRQPHRSAHPSPEPITIFESERKQITVLFSDLSGYTTISERLDPEEVKEVMHQIFDRLTKVIAKYEGFVERIIGDGVLALFGIPTASEDHAVRAVRTALEIHAAVRSLSADLRDRLGQPIAMHTGINSGLVVTGRVDLMDGKLGVGGDTVNTASRLADIATAGEILVGPATYRQTLGHFHFKSGPLTQIKGKRQPIQLYQLLAPRKHPIALHHQTGVQARLIGRKAELARLRAAYERLLKGKGTIFTISGEAGTGKSRLVQEFKAELNLETTQWIEGHAYTYTQKIPYVALINMFDSLLKIEEGDPCEQVKEKIESGLRKLLGDRRDLIPYIGSLHGLDYPQIETMSPEEWNTHLYEATYEIIMALCRKAPTIFCFEDLHWADAPTLALLSKLSVSFRIATIMICTYRPPFTFYTHHQQQSLGSLYQGIHIDELSRSEAYEMMESLLRTEAIPAHLGKFITDRAGGNPFYLEEIVNSLMESQLLSKNVTGWQLTGDFDESDIPPTVHGVIAARLDRLEAKTKRILQEASVIGRSFMFEILEKITAYRSELERCFNELERIDLIRTRALYPDLEFIFKHALTQEVGYSSLLKKERQEIHERIAHVMEDHFQDRLSEFYETLALHYKQGKSVHKAVTYLIKSGEKSLRRYALDESHQYLNDAYSLLGGFSELDPANLAQLIDVILHWSFVFYYRGDYGGLIDLLKKHLQQVEMLKDDRRKAMYNAWLGCALWHRADWTNSQRYLLKALKLGEASRHHRAIGYACTWLTWVTTELGSPSEALAYGHRAQSLVSEQTLEDSYVYFNSLAAVGYAHWHRGEHQETRATGRDLLAFGRRHANVRAMVLGHCCTGWAELICGDLPKAVDRFEKAVKVSVDPWYSMFPKLALCYAHVSLGNVAQAEALINELLQFSRRGGAGFLGEAAGFFREMVNLVKGVYDPSLATMETMLENWRQNGSRLRVVTCGYALVRLYLTLYRSRNELKLPDFLKPDAALSQRIDRAIQELIAESQQMEARGILAQAYLCLGHFNILRGERDDARKALTQAIDLFKACQANAYLEDAQQALADLTT